MASDAKIIRINWNPSPRVLRQFGWIAWFVSAILILRWNNDHSVRTGVVGIFFFIACLGTWKPNLNKPLFLGLTMLSMPIGIVVGEIALLLIYFGQIFPISIVFRLIGRDSLRLKIERNSESYWSTTNTKRRAKDYFHQF